MNEAASESAKLTVLATSQAWSPTTNKPRYYTPFTARVAWLATILIGVLACVAVLETALQTGHRGGEDDDDLDKRWIRRQESSTSSGIDTASNVGTTSSNDATTTLEVQTSSEYIAISTDSDDGVAQSTASSKYQTLATTSGGYIAISTSSSKSKGDVSLETAASTASDGEGGYVAISTSSSESILFNRPTSDYITVSTTSKDTTKPTPTSLASAPTSDYVEIKPTSEDITATAPTSDYINILTTITSDGTPIPVMPTTYTSKGQEYTSYETIGTEEVTAASAAQTDYQSITVGVLGIATSSWSTIVVTTTLEDGTLETVTTTSAVPTSAPSAPGEVKASQIQIGTRFTEMDYFTASYLSVLVAVVLKSIWAMVFASLKMMEPFYYLARPEGATAKDSLLADYLSTGYSISHIKHIFSGHWVMLSCTIAYIGFAILPPLATEASTVVATAYCTTPDGSQQPCTPVWVLNYNFVRGLEAVLCLIALLIIIITFLSWSRKSGIFANPSSLATMASLLSHEETLNDLRQLDQASTDEQLAHTLYNNHYTLGSYETTPNSSLYRYGICKTTSSTQSDPYTLSRFRNFNAQAQTHYSALQNPSASDYSLPNSFPSPMSVYPKTSPITTSSSTTPFSIPRRTLREIFFLAFLFALLGVIVAYYLDGSSSAFNQFFNSHTFGPGFILTAAAVIIDFHFKTLEREVRILVPYRNLGLRMAKPETSVLMNIGGTAVENLPKALWRGEWFHALIAGTAVLSDFLIVAVAGVPYSTAQVWQAFLASAYLSIAILSIMILSVFGVFWWRNQIKKLQLPREPDTLLSVWLMLCDEGNELRKEFDGWETTSEKQRGRACKGRGARYWGGWRQDADGSGRWRWCVGVDGGGREGMVVGYG